MNNKICMCCGKILSDENMYWHPSCIKKMFDSYSITKIDINEDKIIDENLNAGNIVTGVQKKFSLDINVRKARKTISVMNQEYIIKTQQANLNNIVYIPKKSKMTTKFLMRKYNISANELRRRVTKREKSISSRNACVGSLPNQVD